MVKSRSQFHDPIATTQTRDEFRQHSDFVTGIPKHVKFSAQRCVIPLLVGDSAVLADQASSIYFHVAFSEGLCVIHDSPSTPAGEFVVCTEKWSSP